MIRYTNITNISRLFPILCLELKKTRLFIIHTFSKYYYNGADLKDGRETIAGVMKSPVHSQISIVRNPL